jgi:hypothetical protein
MHVVSYRVHTALSHLSGHFFRNRVPPSSSPRQPHVMRPAVRVRFVTLTTTRLITRTDAAHADIYSYVMSESPYSYCAAPQ